jgi:indolepyruvate ferredoxin oxidoreductase alpha subunit
LKLVFHETPSMRPTGPRHIQPPVAGFPAPAVTSGPQGTQIIVFQWVGVQHEGCDHPTVMADAVLLGDEAVALGAVHAGLTAGYAYPGTPSTEITEFLLAYAARHGRPHAAWASNEKTAFEEALGVSFVGRRALVSMKHVGLNVAADPFMNAALVAPHGGLVVAVADDPGMHSSQNEQDSRYYADFARVVCFEPADQQEAYDMTREAYEVSERFRIPVLVRLVTRLAHARSIVRLGEPRPENPLVKPPQTTSWILLPVNARRQWRALLARQGDLRAYAEGSPYNRLIEGKGGFGVITTGIARNYYLENLDDLDSRPWHLHIGVYPVPTGLIRRFMQQVDRVLVLEDGYPFVERQLRTLLPTPYTVLGRETGEVSADGELTPDTVRRALGLPVAQGVSIDTVAPPARPPQLCQGCPHGDSYRALKEALASFDETVVTSDIGCYTLGALPPYSAIESCVCMGASVGMAKGAAEAGFHPAIAVIGDSTFLHSGVTGLMDAVAANADMTLVILDNETVGMTGAQPTVLPSSRIQSLVLGLGVDPDHCHVLSAHPRHGAQNADVLRREMTHRGLSVVVLVRECLEVVRQRKVTEHAAEGEPVAGGAA